MGRIVKKSTLFLAILCIGIQFFRPNKNKAKAITLDDFLITEKAPEQVKSLIKNACYDCHSNQTNYLWYDNIAPASWFVDGHIKRGKGALNLSNWAAMDFRDKRRALSLMATNITESKMPLESYLVMHNNATLSEDDKKDILKWLYTIEIVN